MKKNFFIFICILASIVLMSGCGKKQQEDSSLFAIDPLSISSEPTPQPEVNTGLQGLEAASTDQPTVSADPSAAPAPEAQITDTVAYVFNGAEGPTLYGGAAYENTGNCPVVITGATLSFTIGGIAQSHDYIPVMSDIAVLLPGETGFLAWWNPDPSLTPGASAALAVELSCCESAGTRISVIPGNLYLADNYPGFTTMTGSLEADGECSLNLIYTGFYDESGKLLGVWHFTKNAPLDPGESKTFAVHMKELPIDSLAEKTKEIRTYGVGF